jgi:hypothetical protein
MVAKKNAKSKKGVKRVSVKKVAVEKKVETVSLYGNIPEYNQQKYTSIDVELSELLSEFKRHILSKNKLDFYVKWSPCLDGPKKSLTIRKARGKFGIFKEVKFSALSKKDKEVVKTLLALEKLVK